MGVISVLGRSILGYGNGQDLFIFYLFICTKTINRPTKH